MPSPSVFIHRSFRQWAYSPPQKESASPISVIAVAPFGNRSLHCVCCLLLLRRRRLVVEGLVGSDREAV
jgi:hypothetical protein